MYSYKPFSYESAAKVAAIHFIQIKNYTNLKNLLQKLK